MHYSVKIEIGLAACVWVGVLENWSTIPDDHLIQF